MILICDYCGKEYKTYINPRCKKHYCSRLCASKGRITSVKLKCDYCGKDIIKQKSSLKRSNKHSFCNKECFDNWQSRNKLEFTCKICGKKFYKSPSWLLNSEHKAYYCTIECRNKDEEWKKKSVYKGNYIQCKKKGLNKLELAGNKILDKLELNYKNQYLINDKFCVDVFLPEYNLIIQWNGNYWHGKNKNYNELEPRIKKRVDLDKSQDSYLRKCSYRILRFWEDEVYKKEDYVYEVIKRTIQEIT